MIEVTVVLENKSGEPLYLQLYNYFKQEIQNGRIKPGEMLPSKRKLSLHLGISQNTVETAYHQLLAEGYVDSVPRKGIFVNEINTDLILQPSKDLSRNTKVLKEESEPNIIDFSHGRIALEYFPFASWRRLTIQSLYDDQSMFFLNGD